MSKTNKMINMRVTANSIQGHRKYMEDCYKIRFQRESSLFTSKNKEMLNAAKSAGYLQSKTNVNNNSQTDILFSYFGIFDGHGGKEASQFAKENLYWKIVELEDFWSDDDDKVLSAIKQGFIKCHMEMWDELSAWPKTPSGLPSTSGSTATVLFIKKSKAYVGHVGDSGLVIGYTKNSHSATSQSSSNIPWLSKKLTKDHKPEDPTELKRIESCGGSVMNKGGVNRVVWNRPVSNQLSKRNNLLNSNSMSHISHYNNNVIKNQPQNQTERIPFLAVARSLGDLWSYDSHRDEFIVSPVPDVFHFDLDPRFHKCLILATDGLWNVMRASECVELVRLTDKETDELKKQSNETIDNSQLPAQPFVNPSQRLNNVAFQRCCEKMIRADNTTCITIMLDQPIDLDEDDYLNSDETVIQAANITSLAPYNKTFDKSRNINDSEYFHENVINKVVKDENNLSRDLIDDDDDEDLESYKKRRSRHRDRNSRVFNQTTSTTIDTDFNTPLNNEKRSRSLMSLRRRHWSASSNRSSSNNNITALNTLNNRNKYVNSEYREQRKLFSNNNDYEDDYATENKYKRRNNQSNINKSNSSHCISNSNKNNRFQNASNYESVPNFNQTTRSCRIKISKTTTTTLQIKQTQQQNKKNLNASSISFKGLNRISKNLRKSLNDIYSTNDNKKKVKKEIDDLEESKENHNSTNKESDNSREPTSKYARRLQRFKKHIIKTKNNIFSKKNSKNDLNITKSMPDLNKIDLKDEDEKIDQNNKPGQSFVNSFKSKFNNLKRNNKIENNTQSKRPKFY